MGVGFACLAHTVRTLCPPFPGTWPRSHASLSQGSLRLTLPDFRTPHDRISGAISQRSQGAWQERNNPYLSPQSPTAPESTAPSLGVPIHFHATSVANKGRFCTSRCCPVHREQIDPNPWNIPHVLQEYCGRVVAHLTVKLHSPHMGCLHCAFSRNPDFFRWLKGSHLQHPLKIPRKVLC